MMDTTTSDPALFRELAARIDELEARVLTLESSSASTRRAARRSEAGGSGSGAVDAASWTTPYRVAQVEVSETWIELHEQSARPQLQRLVRQVVDEEGPITDRLVLDRIRRAWGLKRAGGRVQEAFEQAVRQLVARNLVEREEDALRSPGIELDAVRIPSEDEASRRSAEDVPLVELALAIGHAARTIGGRVEEDVLTMQVAKLFGWTRRGGAIQERLDAALELADRRGMVEHSGGRVRSLS